MTRAAFSPDGARIYSNARTSVNVSSDEQTCELHVWDASTGALLASSRRGLFQRDILATPDGRSVLTLSQNRRDEQTWIEVWDVR